MRSTGLIAVGILAAAVVACQDLEVTNPNNPDREVVARSPSDVEALISSSFRQWFNRAQSNTPSLALSTMADELTSGFFDFGTQEMSREPRQAVNNAPNAPNSPHTAPFSTYYSIIAGVNAALRAITVDGLRITSGSEDVTMRAYAFGKFVQGISHGQIAILYDQGWVHSESMDVDTLPFGGGSTIVRDLLRPYTVIRDSAIAQLEEALRVASENDFTLPGNRPGEWIPGLTMSNEEFARLIHTYIARIMVYTARSPEERAAVDWARVISHIDNGITEDFAPVGSPDILQSTYKQLAARQRTVTPGDFARVDYMVVGPADTTNAFIQWYNTPWEQRQPFRIMTPDARIGTNHTDDRGLYIGYHEANVWAADRGTGQRSYYFFHRLGRLESWRTGPLPIVTVAEMDLLKAEGLIRLNRAAEAVDLINKTRVANGNLPPVTVDGVPGTAPACVPRKLNGECGSLWDALRYEKRIEGIGVDATASFADARGWGALVVNTPVHFPIPGNQLQLMQMAPYTTGGGHPGSAPPPDPERCPPGVTLARCP
ncbi:MAG TPA: hypothetical protein VIL18_06610 [Longimicrobiales bacterium]